MRLSKSFVKFLVQFIQIGLTITGKTLYENVKDHEITNEEVIRRKENPYSPVGGLSVLFGNIAPDGGVIKVGAVDPSIKEFTGEAIVFDSQEESQEAIDNGTVKEGHVVVIRYEGPKGGPGMPEMLAPTSAIQGRGLGTKLHSLQMEDFQEHLEEFPSVIFLQKQLMVAQSL